MKNLLLTGGLGYIGSKFREMFSDQYNITILDTGFYSSRKINLPNTRYIDIRNIEKKDLNNIDFVVHMSELSNDPLGNLSGKLTFDINQNGTKKLLDLCQDTKVEKFIYMSSASIYGYSEVESSENSKTNPLTDYAKAKESNELLLQNENYNFQKIIMRNATAFGFSNNLRLDLVINDLAYSGFAKNELVLISDGSPKRPFIHISDICTIIDRFLNDQRNFDKEIFNIGSKELNLSIRDVAEKIKEYLNIEKLVFGDFDPDQRSYYLNFEKLNKTFGDYKIIYNLERGLEDLIKNFEQLKLSGNEIRLNKIKYLLDQKKLDSELFWR
tara:strand:+ start:2879 stop:3859 length:981 start_codon:yes stop_codon:yes gene_type:complete